MQARMRQMTDAERLRVRDLRSKRKLSYEAIADILSNDSEDGRKFDRATIYRAYKSMPELPIDAQFQWHKMDNEEYDLPWEASAYLLELWRFTVERGVYSLEEMDLPTVREVRWRWRIHLADLDLDMSGVLSLAWAFWAREIMQDLLEVPMELDDLEALLAYKPWQNNEMFEDYLRAIREQRIPFINGFSIDEMDKKIYEMPVYRDQFFLIAAGVALFQGTNSIRQEKS